MILPKVKKTAVGVAAVIATAALTAHMAVTVVFLMPDGPFKESARGKVDAYIKPYFDQNWMLFAPDPVERDSGLLVRAKTKQSPKPTEFVDLTSPGLVRGHHDLLRDRLPRVESGTLYIFQDTEHLVRAEYAEKHPEETEEPDIDERILSAVSPQTRQQYEKARRRLVELAALRAAQMWGEDVTEIQIRIGDHEYPRFGDRTNRGPGEVSYRDLAWAKA